MHYEINVRLASFIVCNKWITRHKRQLMRKARNYLLRDFGRATSGGRRTGKPRKDESSWMVGVGYVAGWLVHISIWKVCVTSSGDKSCILRPKLSEYHAFALRSQSLNGLSMPIIVYYCIKQVVLRTTIDMLCADLSTKIKQVLAVFDRSWKNAWNTTPIMWCSTEEMDIFSL